MSTYVPPGSIETIRAVIMVAETQRPDLISIATVEALELAGATEQAKFLARVEPLLPAAIAQLRDWLCAGSVVAEYEDKLFGGFAKIDPQRWATESADGVIETGRYFPFGRPVRRQWFEPDTSCRVLIDRDSLAKMLQIDQLRSSSHADITSASPHKAAVKQRGPRADITRRVIEEMKTVDREALTGMIEKEMKTRFKASRDTCRKARNVVLGFVDN